MTAHARTFGGIGMTYMNPDRICDLVMKGGITSGIVYPPAIDRVAQRFWLSGIGGTSAGAIAAALAAAAEYRRRNGSPAGFEQLRDLPKEISGDGRMLALFKPDRQTRDIFNLAIRASEAFKNGGLLAKAGVGVRAAWKLVAQQPMKRMVNNGMGLCSGMAHGNTSDRDPLPPLTEWLSNKIDSIAGLQPGEGPLTFGHLRTAKAPATPGFAEAMDGEPGIKLQLVSTCLTFGRPYALPYLDGRFAFSVDEFSKLFPAYVVDYLQREGEKSASNLEHPSPAGHLPFPAGDQMPVIVAVRMSLCFPALFSLIPMQYLNFEPDPPAYEPVHFADGGITSNLPVYFFDSPIPRWPTLAINLQYTQQDGAYGRRHVDTNHTWMTKSNADGKLELFNRFLSGATSFQKLCGLGGAIFRSAQVWSDNSFMKLPGYTDRIGEIWLNANEGGMNLNMPPAVIADLVRYGDAIGARLVQRFAEAPGADPMSWDGHRWCRYRCEMAALVLHLRRWARGMSLAVPDDRLMDAFLESLDAPPSYKFRGHTKEDAEQRLRHAREATRKVRDLVEFLDRFPAAPGDSRAGYRPFEDGPTSWLSLQGRASLTPPLGPSASPERR